MARRCEAGDIRRALREKGAGARVDPDRRELRDGGVCASTAWATDSLAQTPSRPSLQLGLQGLVGEVSAGLGKPSNALNLCFNPWCPFSWSCRGRGAGRDGSFVSLPDVPDQAGRISAC